jgi:addiction module RelE/StbE family toxin
MKIFVPSTRFKKKFKKVPKEVVASFKKKLVVFEENIFDETLNNHKLRGKYEDCRSINITSDWRLVYMDKGEDTYLLIDIGTHSELYG